MLTSVAGQHRRGARSARSATPRRCRSRASSSISAASSSITSSTSGASCRSTSSDAPMTPPRHAEHRSRRPRRAGAARQHGDGRREQARHLHSVLLLSQEALDRRELPDVPRAGREGAEAAAGLRDAGHRRHEGVDAFGAGDQGAAGRDGVPADQPSARLPDLRPGRRMPVAGPRRRLRRVGFALPREEARRVPQVHGPAHLRRGDDALHPLHALHSLRPGDRRHHGARHVRPRRARRDRDVRRPHRRLRVVRAT